MTALAIVLIIGFQGYTNSPERNNVNTFACADTIRATFKGDSAHILIQQALIEQHQP